METKESEVYHLLDQLHIVYQRIEHPAVFTCEEADQYMKDIDAVKTKSLFLYSKKSKNFYLVILDDQKRLNIKELSERIGEKQISFASEDRLQQYLGLTPGSVSLFGIINDHDKKVRLLIDETIFQEEWVSFHPNVNTATLIFTISDMKKILKELGYPYQIIAF